MCDYLSIVIYTNTRSLLAWKIKPGHDDQGQNNDTSSHRDHMTKNKTKQKQNHILLTCFKKTKNLFKIRKCELILLEEMRYVPTHNIVIKKTHEFQFTGLLLSKHMNTESKILGIHHTSNVLKKKTKKKEKKQKSGGMNINHYFCSALSSHFSFSEKKNIPMNNT